MCIERGGERILQEQQEQIYLFHQNFIPLDCKKNKLQRNKTMQLSVKERGREHSKKNKKPTQFKTVKNN